VNRLELEPLQTHLPSHLQTFGELESRTAEAPVRHEPLLDPRWIDGPRVIFYSNEIPDFVEAELDRLYGSIYANLGQYRIYADRASDACVHTYVVCDRWCILALLLFRIDDGVVRVLNEVIHIDSGEITRFAAWVFAHFEEARVVTLRAVHTDRVSFPFRAQRYNHLEDIVLQLPGTVEDYRHALGKSTRRNLRRYGERFQQDFPAMRLQVLQATQASDETVRAIVALNWSRMAGKNRRSNLNESAVEKLTRLVQQCGLLCVVTIGDRVCAGAISFRARDNYFLSVLAHDPDFDAYSLGMLCCYQIIGECIERGGQSFHFLWGEYDYKYQFRGVRTELDNLVLYRSRLALLRHSGLALSELRQGLMRQCRLWLQAQRRANGLVARLLINPLVRSRRNLRRWQVFS
jgi:hypothetical protein